MAGGQDRHEDDLARQAAEGLERMAHVRQQWMDDWADNEASRVLEWLRERWPDNFPDPEDDHEFYVRLGRKVREHLDRIAEDVFTEAADEAGIDPVEAFAYLEAVRGQKK